MPNTIELYANNARTTLAGSANNTVTSLVLQSGAGALFPSPNNTIGEYAKATLQDSATGLRNEIVYITARTGDVLTVIRGQDGSTAQTWSAGDTVFEGVTAATLSSFVQPSKLQSGEYIYASATGTTSAYVATLTPAIATVNAGLVVRVNTNSVGTNTTTTPTLNVNGLGAFTIVKQGGALQISDMPKLAQLQYDATLTQWVLLNPAKVLTLLAVQTFTTPGTYTFTPAQDAKKWVVEVIGGGGGGAGVPSTAGWTGGGVSQMGSGGAYAKSLLTEGMDGVTITVGAAGAAGAAGGAGGNGGTSSVGALITCGGGLGAAAGVNGMSSPVVSLTTKAVSTAVGGNIVNVSGTISVSALNFGAGQAAVGVHPYPSDLMPYGFGGSGRVSAANAVATAGTAGTSGAVIVWEYA